MLKPHSFKIPNKGMVETTYSYNNQGVRFKKTSGNDTTTYYHDGAKLLGEDLPDGRRIRYTYDIDGISGFLLSSSGSNPTHKHYRYVKDPLGNVVAVTGGDYKYTEEGGSRAILYLTPTT